MKRYDGRYNEGLEFEKPGLDIVFGDKSRITDDSMAISVGQGASGSRFTIEGDISSAGQGLHSDANNTKCTITNTAKIDAYQAIFLSGAHQSVRNAGTIIGGDAGVITRGSDARLINDGSISGRVGAALLASEDGHVVNRRSGEIEGELFGIAFRGITTESENKLVNFGSITSQDTSFSGGISVDHVINRGVMKGKIALDSGDDMFDGRHGKTIGVVNGGGDDDKYLIDNARIELFEYRDGGWDTVVSSVGYRLPENFEKLVLQGQKNLVAHGNDGGNTLIGNAGDNTLNGYEGNNVLAGGRGNDQLFGGSSVDTFVFKTGDGRDTIQTFQPGVDRLALEGWKGMSSFDDILSHAREKGGGVVISFRGDQLVIDDCSKELLQADDFQF
jgi:Ca2+-binding RTX toxin-like protein